MAKTPASSATFDAKFSLFNVNNKSKSSHWHEQLDRAQNAIYCKEIYNQVLSSITRCNSSTIGSFIRIYFVAATRDIRPECWFPAHQANNHRQFDSYHDHARMRPSRHSSPLLGRESIEGRWQWWRHASSTPETLHKYSSRLRINRLATNKIHRGIFSVFLTLSCVLCFIDRTLTTHCLSTTCIVCCASSSSRTSSTTTSGQSRPRMSSTAKWNWPAWRTRISASTTRTLSSACRTTSRVFSTKSARSICFSSSKQRRNTWSWGER